MNNKPGLSQLWNDVAIECIKTAIFINDPDRWHHSPKFENFYLSNYFNYIAEAIAMLVNNKFLTTKQHKIMQKHKASLETIINKQYKFIDISNYDAAEL